MKQKSYAVWLSGALLALTLTACGGGQDATPTAPAATTAPTATAATAAPTITDTPAAANAAAAVSPLDAPTSPLSAPVSPLAPTAGEPEAGVGQGPHIEIAVPSDLAVITQLAQETKSPTPQEGAAALSGVLYSANVNRIIPGTTFYLTPAIEDNGQLYIPSVFVGPQVERGDIAGTSNEKGQIMLDNVPPGNYYLAVWAIYNWPLAFGAQNDSLPLMITVKAGEQQDFGLLYVDWP